MHKWVLVLVPTRTTSQGNGRSKLLRLNVGQIVDQLIQVVINIILELREEFKVTILAKLPVPHLLIFQVKGKIKQYKKFKKINQKILKITIFRQNICIRQEAGFCCVEYSTCSDTNSWTIDNTANSKQGTNCATDFVEISGKN